MVFWNSSISLSLFFSHGWWNCTVKSMTYSPMIHSFILLNTHLVCFALSGSLSSSAPFHTPFQKIGSSSSSGSKCQLAGTSMLCSLYIWLVVPCFLKILSLIHPPVFYDFLKTLGNSWILRTSIKKAHNLDFYDLTENYQAGDFFDQSLAVFVLVFWIHFSGMERLWPYPHSDHLLYWYLLLCHLTLVQQLYFWRKWCYFWKQDDMREK